MFLVPFAISAPVGVGIGVALTGINAWAQMVLYALATGFFLFVGACEVRTRLRRELEPGRGAHA